MEYFPVQEAAAHWGLSVRRVQYLCQQGMVPGALRVGKVWMLPKNTEKPRDKRYKANAEEPVIAPFPALAVTSDMLSTILEHFPLPIQVYTPDGTLIQANEASLRLMSIPSKELVIGKFNVLKDPIIDKWGNDVRAAIAKSFQGETVEFRDMQMPTQSILGRFGVEDVRFDSSFYNITCFPIFDVGSKPAYVVHVFVASKVYDGKEELVKAKVYIQKHWLEDFSLDKVAAAVHLSRYHFSRLFKRYTSMTPFSYYQSIKINKIAEKLLDNNLSINEVFSACGVDYNGHYSRLFKAKFNMTPSQYRKSFRKP